MLRVNRHFVWSVLLILAVVVNLMNVNVALADDSTPPPPSTEEPTQPPVEPTETPVVEETPVSAETPVSEEQPPTEEEATPSDLLAEAPENTVIVVLDENGNPVPLASQEAAVILEEADPIWCPAAQTTPTPGSNGCTTNQTITSLLTLMRNNPSTFDENGIIYLEKPGGAGFTTPLILDNTGTSLGSSFAALSAFNLTIRGGWNGNNPGTFSGDTNFGVSGSNQGIIRIGSSSNPWIGNITIQDINVTDISSASNPSVAVYTTAGNVTLNDVDVTSGENNDGIRVTTTNGSISIIDSAVDNQGGGYTANLTSQSGSISVTGDSSFDGDNTSNTNQGFMASTVTGSIIITGTSGNRIEFTDAEGSGSVTNYNGASLSAPVVTLNYVTADDNDLNGIQISNANTITLNNVIATNNGTDISSAPDFGSGVRVFGTGSTVVNITSGTYSNNERYPIEISNGTFTIVSAPSMTGNDEGNSIVVDNTPPAMVPSLTCSLPGNAGWCRGTITINWGVSDAQSAVNTSGCQTSFSTNTSPAGTVLSCSATSTGGTTTGTVTVRRDAIAPNTTGAKSPSANSNGWNNTNVIVSFSGTDANSGIASCTSPVTITTEGSNQPVAGSCTDAAGNTSTTTVTVSIDKTPPTVNAALIPAPNANGWNNSGVLITFTGNDPGGSGVPFGGCSPLLGGSTSEGGNQVQSSTCTDRAGNSGSTTVILNIDLTNPTATATKSPLPNANGWNNTNVVVTFNGSDTVSGIAACTPPATVSTEGVNQSRSGTCTDLAGRASNTATANNINIDKTPPAISFVSRTPANGNGWNNDAVTVTWSCTDALSGVVSSAAVQTISAQGANQSVTGMCQDLAGNTSSNTQSGINIDSTSPTLNLPLDITVEATGPSGATVNYSASANDNLDASVIFGCTDLSGNTFPIGTTIVTCTAEDDAGNIESGSFNITVEDTTPPALTLPTDMILEATGPAGAAATFSATANDVVDGALTVTCAPPSGSAFPITTTSVACSATDARGNSAIETFDVTVQDTTPPAISPMSNINILTLNEFGSYAYFTNPSTSDIVDGSGVATCNPPSGSLFAPGSTTVLCSATDSQGNTSSITFTVDVSYRPATTTPTGSGAFILVTGGELIDLQCNMVVNAFGVIVKFHNLCNNQAVINNVGANALPGSLPSGYTYVQGLDVQVLANGQALQSLPDASGVELNFPLSDGSEYGVLYWNNGQWVEITQPIDASNLLSILSTDAAVELYEMSTSSAVSNNVLTTDLTGMFVLVKK